MDGHNVDFATEVFDKVAQRYILAVVFYALDGENWKLRHHYVTDLTTCLWRYVTCNAEGLLIQIDLGNNNLAGSIPAEIGFIPNLEELILDSNLLTGSIPSSIFQLSSQLTHLSLRHNDLVGPIPTEIGQLGLCQLMDLCKYYYTPRSVSYANRINQQSTLRSNE